VSRRLLISYLALAIVVLALLEIPLGISYARNERHDLSTNVERDAVALASLAEDALEQRASAPPAVARLARRYQRDTGGRVVVVDAQGRALVDSESQGVGADFSSRPEIAAALDGTVATGTRHSNTLGTDLLYVAVPAASGGIVHGAVRITYPTSEVDERVRRYWLVLAAIAAVVLAVAVALAGGFARWIVRPLSRVEEAAGEVAAGNLNVRVPATGPPELRRLAGSFNEMVVQLGSLLHSQEQFVADASHQLRTPLTALRLRLENLARDGDGRREGEFEAALEELERLSALVDGLLTLARADRAASTPAELDVASGLGERVDAWSALAEEQQVRLVARVEGRLHALATPGRLEQVLDNLLANALEVAPAGSDIELTAARSGPWVEIRIRDRGPGMSSEEIAHAFDRFWRGGADEAGFGLGLAIVQRLVHADGGEIELRPREGGGLEAILRLRASVSSSARVAARGASRGER
jgi:signal transduction histidine kinase